MEGIKAHSVTFSHNLVELLTRPSEKIKLYKMLSEASLLGKDCVLKPSGKSKGTTQWQSYLASLEVVCEL